MECADWRNPTPEAVEEAKSKGIDLTDPEVIDMLEEYEEEARIGGKQLGRQNQVQHLVSDSVDICQGERIAPHTQFILQQ